MENVILHLRFFEDNVVILISGVSESIIRIGGFPLVETIPRCPRRTVGIFLLLQLTVARNDQQS